MSRYIYGTGYLGKSAVVLKSKTHIALAEVIEGTEYCIRIAVKGENPKNLLDIFRIFTPFYTVYNPGNSW